MKEQLESRFIGELVAEPSNVMEAMRLITEEHLHEPLNKKIYSELVRHFTKHGTIDLVVFSEETGSKYDVPVTEAHVAVAGKPSAFSVYVRALIERRAKQDGHKAIKALEKSFQLNENVREAVDLASKAIMDVRDMFDIESVAGPRTVAEETLAMVERVNTGDETNLVKWPLVDLNRATGGMEPGDLVIISGVGKGGKTKLMLETFWANARRNVAGLIFSAEMRRSQLFLRQALAEGKISYIRFRNQRLTDQEKDRLNKTIESYAKLPIYVRHGAINIMDIMADTERFVRKRVRLIGVDYVQRIQSVDIHESREREVARISAGLKDIAMKYGVPVIALSQVNKEMEARESRAIEHDMDKMIVIQREEDSSIAEVKLVQRFGKGGGFGEIKFHWDQEFGRWDNYAETMEDVQAKEEDLAQEALPI